MIGDAKAEFAALTTRAVVLISLGAVACFHLACLYAPLAFLMWPCLAGLFALGWVKTTRLAFYLGLGLGLAMYGPELLFFVDIMGPGGAILWLALAIGLALFLLLARCCVGAMRQGIAVAMIPFVWTGLEYFRGELYPLKFSWLSAGYAFRGSWHGLLGAVGMYGLGFAMMSAAAILALLPGRLRIGLGLAVLLGLAAATVLPYVTPEPDLSANGPLIVGIQLEHPSQAQVLDGLSQAMKEHPQADLLVLSEYTFLGDVPQRVLDWCKENRRYLIAGGTAPADGMGNYFNTAFVISPGGEIVFQQAKCVPIQFFSDGLPATRQEVWNSPWGKIGICVCYDLSYTRITDELIRQGAGLLIVPTMDLAKWGRQEHALHACVAPVRAAEYGVPIFRACSSGISQFVDAQGATVASAPFPGPGMMIAGRPGNLHPGRAPLDRLLSPVCVGVTGIVIVVLAAISLKKARRQKALPKDAPQPDPGAAVSIGWKTWHRTSTNASFLTLSCPFCRCGLFDVTPGCGLETVRPYRLKETANRLLSCRIRVIRG